MSDNRHRLVPPAELPRGHDAVSAAKRVLRSRLRAARRERPARPPAAGGLADRVLALPEVIEVTAAGLLAAYVSRDGEAPTEVLLERLAAAGVPVLLPVVRGDLDLDWVLDDGTRRAGYRGLAEPAGAPLGRDALARADVVLVPALAVDGSGNRLGQGGGSYDRALARARPDALLVALVHDEELLAGPLPVLAHDRSVHAAVTPLRAVRFSR